MSAGNQITCESEQYYYKRTDTKILKYNNKCYYLLIVEILSSEKNILMIRILDDKIENEYFKIIENTDLFDNISKISSLYPFKFENNLKKITRINLEYMTIDDNNNLIILENTKIISENKLKYIDEIWKRFWSVEYVIDKIQHRLEYLKDEKRINNIKKDLELILRK